MGASVILSGAHPTPVSAGGARSGNTKKFQDLQAAKQAAKQRAKKEKIEKKNEEKKSSE
jgi:hypothetical protein